MKAYVFVPLGVPGATSGSMFTPVQVELVASEPENSVGRALNDMVQSVPKMDPDQFEVMLNSNMRDLLMVVYLSQMTKTQLQLNEKLSMVSVNNLREVAKLLPVEER